MNYKDPIRTLKETLSGLKDDTKFIREIYTKKNWKMYKGLHEMDRRRGVGDYIYDKDFEVDTYEEYIKNNKHTKKTLKFQKDMFKKAIKKLQEGY